jgi:hypothetical protein
MVPPGTQKGMQAQSPVLEDKLHTIHGKQKYEIIPTKYINIMYDK